MNANELREQGNESFKQSQFKKAVNYYSQAIHTILDPLNIKETDEDLGSLQNVLKKDDCLVKCFNNRAQCYIKLESFKKAIEDANKVILANADDTKALFRRSQALKELNRFDESLRDAKRLIQIEPKNNQFIQYIQSLTRLIQDKTNEQRSTKSQVKSMLDYTTNSDREKKLAV